MAQFDLPLSTLVSYHPSVDEPADFDAFWADTIAALPMGEPASFERIDNRQALIDTFDVTFQGASGTPVKAWLHVPAGANGPLPAVVRFRGYSGGRGMPLSNTFATAGYAEFVLDTRGQSWASPSLFAKTDDADPSAGTAGVPGFLTHGLADPATYYYRRVFSDCVRLLDIAARHEMVDPKRIIVTGNSQGGAMTIATAGLAASIGVPVAGCAPDVPFLCHIARAVTITDAEPYRELVEHFAANPHQLDRFFNTLSYVDCVNFARRIECPALFSVGLMDEICPPSTVFAAYNRVRTPKDIEVYQFNGHSGGGDIHLWRQLGWMRDIFASV